MSYSSRLIEQAVEALASLPGIGRKTALRLALHLVKQPPEKTETLTQALLRMRREICECSICHNISDTQVCAICADARRDRTIICVVEGIRDVMAIEETGQYRGLYHVLGGLISPIEGVGPSDLHIDSLLERVQREGVEEVLLALSPTIEGDTTQHYIARRLAGKPLQLTTIARGVAFGGELEYADELTLGRSIVGRLPLQMESGEEQ